MNQAVDKLDELLCTRQMAKRIAELDFPNCGVSSGILFAYWVVLGAWCGAVLLCSPRANLLDRSSLVFSTIRIRHSPSCVVMALGRLASTHIACLANNWHCCIYRRFLQRRM